MENMIATRDAYGKALEELGDTYDFYVMDADLSKATKTCFFQRKYPDRFYNIGIAECNMMGVAAGFATCGKTVIASSFAMFSTGRAYEQVRSSICYPNLNVKIAGTHGGIAIGEDGASHQCIEDLSLMRSIPNIIVLNPADAVASRAVVEAALQLKGPVYMRFGKNPQPVIYKTEEFKFEVGKGIVLKDGNDVTIIATGIMVSVALEAHKFLESKGISARVIDMHTIKPVDFDLIVKSARETGAVVTVEDHSITGGLGSAVAEVLSENSPIIMKRIGIENKFGRSGKPDELMKLYGLTADNICTKVLELLKVKRATTGY